MMKQTVHRILRREFPDWCSTAAQVASSYNSRKRQAIWFYCRRQCAINIDLCLYAVTHDGLYQIATAQTTVECRIPLTATKYLRVKPWLQLK